MSFRAVQRYLARRTDSQARQAAKRRALADRRRKLGGTVESLEPRLLFATINYTVDDPANYLANNPNGVADGDVDLTLRIASVRGGAVLQLVDMDKAPGGQVVGSAPLTDSIQVNISGYQATVDGHIEEFPESLVIDFGNATGLNPSAVAIGVNFDGIKGTAVPLLVDDRIDIAPSNSTLYVPASLDVTLTSGDKISVLGPLAAVGNVSLTANDGDIDVVGGGSITAGDIALAAQAQITAQSEADSPDALAMPSATINITGGQLTGSDISLSASATTNVTISATDLRNGQFSVGGVVAVSNAAITIDQNSLVNASGDLTLSATSDVTANVTRGAQDDGNANDDDKDQDAAIAASAVTSSAGIHISDSAALIAGGSAHINAVNLVNVTTTADGTLHNGNSGGNDAGGTVATTTLVGDTEVIVEDSASISAAGDVVLSAASNRSATTTATATTGGAAEDGNAATKTQGQQTLADNHASTSDGDVTLAAAIAVNTVMGETRARVSGGSITSNTGSIEILSSATHNIQTIADGTTTSGQQGTGVGVAVALGLAGVTDPTGATALRSTAAVANGVHLNAAAVNIQSSMPSSVFHTEATSGQSGPSQDQQGNSTGADVGVAGALALGVTITNSTAQIEPNATVGVSGSDLTIHADSSTNSIVKAVPKNDPVTGQNIGIGASVAINITDHTTHAAVENGATLTGIDDLNVSATSFQGVTTQAKTGAAGGTAIAAGVALELANHDTQAEIAPGSTLTSGGQVNVSASHTALNSTTSEGDAIASDDAAIGAAFSMSLVEDHTSATLNRSVSAGGAVTVVSNGNSSGGSTAKASAQGDSDNQGGANHANSQSANQRASGNNQASSRGARDSSNAPANPDASTSEGQVTVAAAIALNIVDTSSSAVIADGVHVDADGKLTVNSFANSDGTAVADGSATQGSTGVGVAVALNSTTIENTASIGHNAVVNADGMSLRATMNDAIHSTSAQATSGAGGSDVGVAGALAINFSRVLTNAAIQSGAVVTMEDGSDAGSTVGPVDVEALSFTHSTSEAKAKATGDTGIGASVAFNLTDHQTRAELEDNADLAGAQNVSLHAVSKHDVTTQAKGGAAGGTAITPVATATLAFPTTEARIGANANPLTVGGDLIVLASHTGVVDADATGKTAGNDAAIGISLGFTYTQEHVLATTERSLTTGGALSLLANSNVTHTADALASASGAKGDQDNQGGSAQDKADNLRASGNSKSTSAGGQDSGTENKATATTASKDGDDDGDAVTVAAAFAVSIVEGETRAEIAAGLSIQSGGLLTVRSTVNDDASAVANGSAVQGDVGIGAAVAINVVNMKNQAVVGNSQIVADGLVVEALMADVSAGVPDTNTFVADAKSGAGGKDVGVAGSLAVNHIEFQTNAVVSASASVTLQDGSDAGTAIGPASIRASANTDNTAQALPNVVNGGAQSDSVGVGVSVALNLTYVDTKATIQDGVAWSGGSASSFSVDAQAHHSFSTDAQNGAKAGDVGIGGAVAVVISKNHTDAHLGGGSGAIGTVGSAAVHAQHTSNLTTTVGSAATGSDAAIGASVGVVIVEDTSNADTDRSLNAGGSVSIQSAVDVASILNAKASAGGGDQDGDDADTESSKQARQPNATENGDNSVPKSSDGSDQANQKSQDQTNSSGGGVGIAAAVAVNAVSMHNTAAINQGADVTAGGAVSVSAPAHIVSHSQADSTSIDTSGDVNVGAAVALNWVSLTNRATIGSGSVVIGNGITVEAVTTDDQTNDYTATAFALAGNKGDAGAAGVLALNVVDADTTAMTANDSHLTSSSDVDVTAEHAMRVQAGAIAGGASQGVALAAAAAINIVGLNENSETGGSRTLASIGDPDSAGPAATVNASGAVNVQATHSIGMFPTLDLPDSLNHPDDPDYAIDDIDIEMASVAVSGGAGTGSFSGAASAGVNLFETSTWAGVAGGATIDTTGALAVSATDTTNLVTMAGALGVATDGAGIGAGLDLAIVHKDTWAFVSKGAQITASQAVSVTADSHESFTSVAATAGVGNSVGLAISASVQVVETTTRARIADGDSSANGATVNSNGPVSLVADGTFATKMIGGSVGAAGTAGVGASNTTLVHTDTVEAAVGRFAIVGSGAGVVVHATSSEDLIGIAAAGGGAGTAGVAGAAAVNVLNESTKATIGDSATVTASNGLFILGAPDVDVLASDLTTIVSVGGSLAASGGVSAGIGADAATINKNTVASIGSNVTAHVEGDILVNANSNEDLTSAAAGLAASSGVSLTLDASVHVFDIKTRAFIGDDPTDNVDNAGPGDVHAGGSVVVAADEHTEIDKVVGSAAVSGTVAVAGGAAVSTVNKVTEAFIGDGAQVTADGKTEGVDARTGRFVTKYVSSSDTTSGLESNNSATMTADSSSLAASGEVGLPQVGKTDGNQDGSADASDPSLSNQRTVVPEVISGFHGVAVTATNRDDIEDYTISLAGSTAAVAISAGVNVINTQTRAYVGQGAKVNEDTSTASDTQSVQVAAGNDFAHVAFAGSVAGGVVGIGPAASVTVLSNATEAYLGWDAQNQLTAPALVNARNDVTVAAHATEDILLVGVGLAGGWVGIGAGVDVLSVDNQTNAAIGPNSTVFARGDAAVLASDDSDIDIVSGGGGGGLVGVGGAVGVLSVTKDTQAWIDTDAVVDARGQDTGIDGIFDGNMIGDGEGFATTTGHGVSVQAQSTEDIVHLAIAAGLGFVGVSGGVAVTLVDSDTSAEIRDGAQINQTKGNAGASGNQDVFVNAANLAHVTSFAGAIAAGAGAVGGAVDFGTLKNDTLARVGNDVDISAKHDVEVNGLGIKHLEGFTFSGGLGAVGLAGAVSIWSVGTQLEKSYSNSAGDQQSAADRQDGAADEDATSQATQGQTDIANGLGAFGADSQGNAKTNTGRMNTIASLASSKLKASGPSKSALDSAINSPENSAGTTASVGQGSHIRADFDIDVEANEDTFIQISVGGFGGGLAGVGGSVEVLRVAANATATSAGTLSAGQTVNVDALLDEDVHSLALAGGVGFVGLGAAVVDLVDSSDVTAEVGSVESATAVTVLANADQQLSAETGQLTGGGLAAGASFTKLKSDGNVTADVLGNSQIGQAPGQHVGSLVVTANSVVEAHNKTVALAAGAVAVSVNSAESEVVPIVSAGIGFGADITVDGAATVAAIASHDATADVLTLSGGAVSVGASLATAKLQGQVGVAVGDAVNVQAGTVTLESRFNHDAAGPTGEKAHAYAMAPSKVPGLAAGTGTSAKAFANTDVTTTVGNASKLTTTVGDIVIRSLGSHEADAQGDAVSLGMAAAVGITDIQATANGDTTVTMNGETDGAADLDVKATAWNHATAIGEAAAVAGAGGAAGAKATTTTSPTVDATLASSGFARAKGTITVAAVADNLASSQGSGGAFGLVIGIGKVNTKATTNGLAKTYVDGNIEGASLSVTTDVTNVGTAKGLSAAGGFGGTGSGVTAVVDDQPTFLAQVSGGVRTQGPVTIKTTVTNTPTASAQTIALAAGVADGGASANVTSKPKVHAEIVGGGVDANGTLTVWAHDTSTVTSEAGAASLALGGAALGSGLATNDVAADVLAAIVHGDHSAGSLSIDATESATVMATADGLVAGGLTLAGGVATNDVHNVTLAEIFNDVFVNHDVVALGDIKVQAHDTSTVTTKVDQAGLAFLGAAGAGAAYTNLENEVTARIADHAFAATNGSVLVTADEDATVHGTAVGVNVAAGAGVAGNVVVNTLANDVEAYVRGQSTVQAGNNLLVYADLVNTLDAAAATSAGGAYGEGGSVVVDTFNNVSRAFVDDGSQVSAAGNGAARIIPQWDAAGNQSSQGLDGIAVIASLVNRPGFDPDGNGPQTPRFVTAYNSAGGLAGQSSINIVNKVDDHTEAFIASSQVNSGDKPGNEVFVRAHSDQPFHSHADGVTGGASANGGVTSRTDIGGYTRAFISDTNEQPDDEAHSSALVYGQQIEVAAISHELVELDVLGITGGGFSIAGGISIAGIQTLTQAFVRDSSVVSQDDLTIRADDTAEISGSVSTKSVGGIAGGTAIGFNSIRNTVQARQIGGELRANNELNILADSNEQIHTHLHSLGAGLAGLAGTVVLNSIETTTEATVTSGDQHAQINDVPLIVIGDPPHQYVKIAATDTAEITNTQGMQAGGLLGGVGAAVEVGGIRNRTVAKVGQESKIHATEDVTVEAHEDRNLDSEVSGFGGGLFALTGAASFLTMGAPSGDDLATIMSEFLKQDDDGNDLESQTNAAAKNQDIADAITDKPGSPSYTIAQKASVALLALADPTVKQAIQSNATNCVTAAVIDDAPAANAGARIDAGGLVSLHANTTYGIHQKVGTENYGLVAVGASVGVATVHNMTTASIGNYDTVSAGDNLSVAAADGLKSSGPIHQEVWGQKAGLGGFDFNLADLNLDNDTTARVGQHAQVEGANLVIVDAAHGLAVDAAARGYGGALTAAAGSVKSTPTLDSTIVAKIEDGAVVGSQRNVDGVQLKSQSIENVDNVVKVGQVGFLGGFSDGTATTEFLPTIDAHVGDATLNVNKATLVSSYGQHLATAHIEQFDLGAAVKGAGTASVSVTGNVTSDMANGADINTGSLTVSAGALNSVETNGSAIGGGVAGGLGAGATSTIDLDVVAQVGDATVDADGSVEVLANSTSTASATGGVVGVVGFGKGETSATATVSGDVSATVLAGANIDAGDFVHVLAGSTNTTTATAQATAFGIVTGGAALTNSHVNVNTLADVDNSHVVATKELRIEADATNQADANSIGWTVDLVDARGHVESIALVDGSTRAFGDGTLTSQDSFIRVQATDDESHAVATSRAAGAGIGFTQSQTFAHAFIQPAQGDNQAQVRARLAGNVNAATDIAVRAKATDAFATAETKGVSLSASIASGGTDSQAKVGQTLRSSIGDGSDVTSGRDTKVEAINLPGLAEAYASAAGGALLGGVAGAQAIAKSVGSAESVVGNAKITAGARLLVTADSKHGATATGDGIAIGLVVGVGDVKADATAGIDSRITEASLNAGADITASELVVGATDTSRGLSYVVGTGGGLVSDQASVSTTAVDTKVLATVGQGVDVDVTGDVSIHAIETYEGDAEAEGNSFGGLYDVGESHASVVLTPVVWTTINKDAAVDAGGNLTVEALANADAPTDLATIFNPKPEGDKGKESVTYGDDYSQSRATGAAGSGFLGILAGSATILTIPSVKVVIESPTPAQPPSLSSDGDIVLKTASRTNSSAQSANDAVGILGAGKGNAIAGVSTTNISEIQVDDDVRIVAGGDLKLSANGRNVGASDAKSTGFGAIGLADADSYTDIDYSTRVVIDPDAQLKAGDELAAIATTNNYGLSDASANGGGVGALTSANDRAEDDNNPNDETDLEVGKARRGVRVGHFLGDTETSVGNGAELDARTVTVQATISRTEGHSTATADSAGAGVDSDSLGRVELWDDAQVNVAPAATITGTDSVLLQANIADVNIGVYAKSTSVGLFAGATATIIADTDTDALVNVQNGALIKTHDLQVKAMVDDVDVPALDPNNSNEKGALSPDRVITFDGDAELTSGRAILVIGIDGSPIEQENVTFHKSGNQIVVDDILNNDPGSVLFFTNAVPDAPQGLVRSQDMFTTLALGQPIKHGVGPQFTFDETLASVTIKNFSNNDLVINDIDVVNRNVDPEVTLDTQSLSQYLLIGGSPTLKEVFGFDVEHSFDSTVIDISDTNGAMPGDILLAGIIDNPIGITLVTDVGGSLLSLGGNSTALIRSNQVGINVTGAIGAAGSPVRLEVVQSDNRPTDLLIGAGDDINLDLRGIERSTGNAAVAFDSGYIQGDDVTITLHDAVKQATVDPNVSYLVDVKETHPVQTTAVENRFRPPQPALASLTVLDLGIFGTSSQAVDATYDFDLITASGGLKISAVPAAKKVSVVADTNVTADGPINVSTSGNVELTETAGNLPVGLISTTGGNVTLQVVSGDIVDQDNDAAADLVGNSLTLHAPAGAIGSQANPLEVNSSSAVAGEVNADAQSHIYVTETSGALNTGVIDSTAGNVGLRTISGSIVDSHNDAAVNVDGKDVTLDADGGAAANLGEANDPLEICATGVVTLTAEGAIPNVKNVCGGLKIKLIQVNFGAVSVASVGKLELLDGGQIVSPSTVTLESAQDIQFAHTSQINATGLVTVNAGNGAVPGGAGANVMIDGVILAARLDVNGGAGSDQITLMHAFTRGLTQVFGSGGNDTIDGSAMVDRLFAHGGLGNDTIIGGSANDLLWGDEGNDTLSGRGGNDALMGDDGNDTLTGDEGRDLLFGGLGSDLLDGGAGEDILVGGVFKLSGQTSVLDALLTAWAQPTAQKTRISALTKLGLKSSNIVDDRVQDKLFGGADSDWFWTYRLDTVDKTKSERNH